MSSPAPTRWARGLVFALTLSPVSLGAHDLWVLAGQYHLEPFETTRIFINSGDRFPQSLTLVGEHRITALALYGPGDTETIGDYRVDGSSLSFEITPKEAGSYVVALATRSRRVRLKPEDFADYLDENGLDAIAAMRDEMGESEQAAVESYAKWAKAMIDVGGDDGPPIEGDGEDPAWSKPVGHPLEIVPTANPNRVGAGEALRVRILYQGEPLPGAQVSGGRAGGPIREIVTTTDDDGYASIALSSAGRWYVRSLHMIRDQTDPEVRWDSFWATMTFEIR